MSDGNGRINQFNVKRIEEDIFELWHEDKCLATLTREEAWPVMMGQIHPDTVIRNQTDNPTMIQDKEQ